MKHRTLRRYLRHGTFPQLAVFEAVARHGSFTRAAEELHVAQPTVSIQVKKLAEAVGLPLFEIVGRRVHLTAAGRELCAACADVFARLDAVEHRLAGMRSATSGTLRVAVTTSGKYFAPRLLARFAERYPAVEIAVEVANRATLLARLAGNLDDFYIFSNPPEDVDTVTQVLQPNRLCLYGRADHPFAQQRGIGFREIAGEPFLLREAGSGTRMVAERAFAARGCAPNVRMELGSDEAIKQAVLDGLGIAILSEHAIGPGAGDDGLACLDVEGFPVEQSWTLVYPAGKQLAATAQAFLAELRASAPAGNGVTASEAMPSGRA